MEDIKFTKQIKADWLKALRSGDFKRNTAQLRSDDEKKHCCLGVLCEIHPQLSIDPNNSNAVANQKQVQGYSVFNQMFGRENTTELWTTNDDSLIDDYSEVIPLIEKLPTVD